MTEERSQWLLRRGQYLGDISAVCFLHLPPRRPLLLAGTGSEILVYELATGTIIRSFEVFQGGVRVHGISLADFHTDLWTPAFRVAVYGERRVKLFTLRIQSDSHPFLHMELTLMHSLPKFTHWVLDVCFLKDDHASYLAIGCSDNSVSFWRPSMLSQVKSAERCLLYSMRMFGDEIESLQVASGTIFNEIVVWRVVSATTLGSHEDDYAQLTSYDDGLLPGPKYKDALISRLVGHEGSILRIAWFANGLELASVSDDRSARIWKVQGGKGVPGEAVQDRVNHVAGPVLFGHNARIWDCCIFDSLIITAGEDCTCRVWDHDGRELNEIKEHIGRGVWRCLYDPGSSLLITAGFDSAIKVHQLSAYSKGFKENVVSEDLNDKKEVFTLSVPNSSAHGGLMDSKSEYVRCLQFSREDSLYVATNNGYLYHAALSNNSSVKWTQLARITEEAPIICMDLLSKCSNPSGRFDDWVGVGDGKGNMTIFQIVGIDWSPKVEFTLTWPAEKERHLLGTHWCRSLENRFIITADPGGRLKLWKICHKLPSVSLNDRGSHVFLVAEYASCFGMRIMCADASFDEELLVCGDIRGNLVLFSLPRSLLCTTAFSSEAKPSPVSYFKGAHGVSSVNSVCISSLSSDQVDICSTGADGCICYLQHDRYLLNLEFIGMNQVKDLSAIRSVFTTTDHDDSDVGKYAIGFASANFIIWNLKEGAKVLQIACGGWRRPHSYYLGDLPEMMNCFSFVKDDVIYIHRQWVPLTHRQIYPRNLHLQFHGREIHSLCFVSGHSDINQGLVSKTSWIATGCEDGTVRLTRYEAGVQNWSFSQHLGEHVGGSAVRSICSVSKAHIYSPDSLEPVKALNGTLEDRDPFILVSVGSKRVVTAWKQVITTGNKRAHTLFSQTDKDDESNLASSSTETMSSCSFQWLSTDMPFRHASFMKKRTTTEVLETAENLSGATSDAISVESLSSTDREMDPNLSAEYDLENDWRYLDVTAFLVKVAASRISVCFVIVASSDATVTLRALVLPFRFWFDVASLAPLSSPVLALQHVAVPNTLPSKGNILYLAITGSTDGSVGIWDLTESVESFMLKVSGLGLEKCLEFQKRPRTGRGSQGGRWWRSIDSHNPPKKKPGHGTSKEKTNTRITKSGNEMENGTSKAPTSGKNDFPIPFQGRKNGDLAPEMSVLSAACVLDSVHQSGVNCLYVSGITEELSESRFSFNVVSGGDDQAINCLRCDLQINPMRENTWNINAEVHRTTTSPMATTRFNRHFPIQNHQMQVLYLDKVFSAHSSAVKGVWTDGTWIFSVGLDQRVRCWIIGHDKLTECAHLIISVPEPEALDVRTCGRNHYEIAVAGRGMQMIEFRPSDL